MKIIFLDIDGVLNSDRSVIGGHHRMKSHDFADDPYHIKFAKCAIDPISCELINKILRDFPETYIVMSSSHRHNYDDGPEKLSQLQQYLTVLGIDGTRLIDYTPDIRGPRGGEIKDWLDRHPAIEAYVIIDDSIDMLDEQKAYFIQTDPAIGISADNYRSITRIFGKEDTGQVFL